MRSQSGAEKMRDADYYSVAHQASTDFEHPSMQVLLKQVALATDILDLGCGEGTRLDGLLKHASSRAKAVGLDVSHVAIEKARQQYPKLSFRIGDVAQLPFSDHEFDLVYSAYVFEHLTDPEAVVKEARRVLKESGKLVIIAPNFGSPNRRSPNSTRGKLTKLVSGLVDDFKLLFSARQSSLNWQTVVPQTDQYFIDADTTIEPYLLSLQKYCQTVGFKIDYVSSNWSQDKFSFFQLLFRCLGVSGFFPFSYWGPHLCLVATK